MTERTGPPGRTIIHLFLTDRTVSAHVKVFSLIIRDMSKISLAVLQPLEWRHFTVTILPKSSYGHVTDKKLLLTFHVRCKQ